MLLGAKWVSKQVAYIDRPGFRAEYKTFKDFNAQAKIRNGLRDEFMAARGDNYVYHILVDGSWEMLRL